MPNTALIEAFARLEASIKKQWGEIPNEIGAELSEISTLINPPCSVPPADEDVAPPRE